MPQLPDALNVGTLAVAQLDNKKELPLLQEWAYDFERNEFLKNENGLPYLVSGNEALKIWVFWAVTTAKNHWLANSRAYGSEIERMVGLPVSVAIKSSELKRTIKESIEQCEYVKHVDSIETSFEDGLLSIDVQLKSVYNEGWLNVSVKV